MHKAFGWDLEQYVLYGGYPGPAPLISDEARWKTYVKDALIEASISKDILMLTRIDKPALLSDCGLLAGISKYAGEEFRSRASQPKFQVYNNSLLSAQSRYSLSEAVLNPKEWGRLEESSIGAHLLNNSITHRYNLHYWRERNDEVDFVIEQDGLLIGIEVKTGRRGENKGMGVFASKFNPTKVILVGTGGIPIDEFLKATLAN